MAMYISLKRDPFLDNGVAPRQRRVFVLRWNPTISEFTREEFEELFNDFNSKNPKFKGDEFAWPVWDWEKVMHRDLFVMMQVGQEVNGIVWFGYLGMFPFQYEYKDGSFSKSHFFGETIEFMHRIEKTGLLTADRLQAAVPDVDWLHGHSGELISVESAEKLGRFMVEELRHVDDCEDIKFDDYNQKQYVIADILTFMCTGFKKRLKELGKIKNKRLRNLHNLMVNIDDEDYENWENLEDHTSLRPLNGILM